jgi:hypothetical protein
MDCVGCVAEGVAHGFAHFWLTDSCASTVREVKGVKPFEVLSLAGSIAVALHRGPVMVHLQHQEAQPSLGFQQV